MDGVFDQVFDLFVAFDGDGDDSAAAGGDLLNVAEGGGVLEDAAWLVRGDEDSPGPAQEPV